MPRVTRFDLIVRTFHNFGGVRAKVTRIRNTADLTQTVLEAITAIQSAQRKAAPKGKQGRIPRSIKPARMTNTQNGVKAISRTTYPPAIFTNEGTGIYASPAVVQGGAPSGKAYFTPWRGGFWHPGIRGTHWWERGAASGSKIAFESFRRKVERMLDVRGV